MQPTRNRPGISVARAGALFVSAVQPSDEPSARHVRQATAAALRRFGDRGCTQRVVQEFGDHPELAAARMRWARRTVATAFAGSGCRQPTARRAEACRQEPPRYPRAWPAGVSVVLGL